MALRHAARRPLCHEFYSAIPLVPRLRAGSATPARLPGTTSPGLAPQPPLLGPVSARHASLPARMPPVCARRLCEAAATALQARHGLISTHSHSSHCTHTHRHRPTARCDIEQRLADAAAPSRQRRHASGLVGPGRTNEPSLVALAGLAGLAAGLARGRLAAALPATPSEHTQQSPGAPRDGPQASEARARHSEIAAAIAPPKSPPICLTPWRARPRPWPTPCRPCRPSPRRRTRPWPMPCRRRPWHHPWLRPWRRRPWRGRARPWRRPP